MADEPKRRNKDVWVGSAFGAVVGIVIGGGVGMLLVSSLLHRTGLGWGVDPLGFLKLFGMAMGAIIGGIGGSALGTRLAATALNSQPVVPKESAHAELARLKERVAELEGKIKNDGLS